MLDLKKLMLGGMVASMVIAMPACSDDDDNDDNSSSLEFTYPNERASQYMQSVTALLRDRVFSLWYNWAGTNASLGDYQDLYDEISDNEYFALSLMDNTSEGGYASDFISAGGDAAIENIFDGCSDIANEVGESKIGGPHNDNDVNQVESWYSWNSLTDYDNNIESVENSYLGKTGTSVDDLDAVGGANSLSALVASLDADADKELRAAIKAAREAITSIPAPFRNSLQADEVEEAMNACSNLVEKLESAKAIALKADEADKIAVAQNYIDKVVLPTYALLRDDAQALYEAVSTFKEDNSQANLNKVADAWREARIGWETSEAFLFGPVSFASIDPAIDSWPLDASAINTYMNSDIDISEENIRAGGINQNVSGFHAIEFFTFLDGKARTVK